MKDNADQKLDDVLIHQIAFKNPVARAIAAKVVYTALQEGEFTVDKIELAFVAKEDKNVIGNIFRMLCSKLNIIMDTGRRCRSKTSASNGREIRVYRLSNGQKARAFLNANPCEECVIAIHPQLSLI